MFKLNLQLFAEGGSGAAMGSGAASAMGGGTPASGAVQGSEGQANQPSLQDQMKSIREKRFGKAEAAKMEQRRTGAKNPAAEGAKTTEATQTDSADPEARKAQFRDLVENQYKDLMPEYHNEVFNKRYKQLNDSIVAEKTRADSVSAKLSEAQPVLDLLMTKHNVKTVADLQKAIEADNAYWEDGARESGMTVEAFKNHIKTTNELNKLKQQEQIQRVNEFQKKQILQWQNEAEELKKTFPDFDIVAESQNPRFRSLLESGVPVALAYNVLHFNDIVATREKKAAEDAKAAYVASLQSKQARPSEGQLRQTVANKSAFDLSTAEGRARQAEFIKRNPK